MENVRTQFSDYWVFHRLSLLTVFLIVWSIFFTFFHSLSHSHVFLPFSPSPPTSPQPECGERPPRIKGPDGGGEGGEAQDLRGEERETDQTLRWVEPTALLPVEVSVATRLYINHTRARILGCRFSFSAVISHCLLLCPEQPNFSDFSNNHCTLCLASFGFALPHYDLDILGRHYQCRGF